MRPTTLALVALSALRLPAQDFAALADRLQADVAQLSAGASLDSWRRSHPGEKLELAHLNTGSEKYLVDFKEENRWCATSINDAVGGVSRSVLFYVPSVKRGALPPLPVKADSHAVRACRLFAVWYQTRPFNVALATILTARWGAPQGPANRPAIGGSALWRNVNSWNRRGVNIWVAFDPQSTYQVGPDARMIVYAVKDEPPEPNYPYNLLDETIQRQAVDAAARIADQDPTLTAAVLSRAHCDLGPPPHEADTLTVDRLAQWLKTSAGLPTERRAASFLVADSYAKCSESAVLAHRTDLGIQLETQHCPQESPGYGYNFREEAETLAPAGRVAEMAAVASFTLPCTINGRGDWRDRVIEKGTRLLTRFPTGQWTAWIHYAIGRAYAAKLALGYPGGDPEEGPTGALAPAVMQQDRDRAVQQFRQFLVSEPNAPESVYAWNEAWRLLAGLPPSRISFGCGCE